MQWQWGSNKDSPKKESPEADSFSAEFSQNIKEELIPTHLKLFHETEGEGMLKNSLYEASTAHIPKPDKDRTKGEL
jgi:hypothetical protein